MDEDENSRFYKTLNYGWTWELQVLQDIKLGIKISNYGWTWELLVLQDIRLWMNKRTPGSIHDIKLWMKTRTLGSTRY